MKIKKRTQRFAHFADVPPTFVVGESFRPPFLKGGAVEDAESSSRSAEREILLLRRFLFAVSRSETCFSLCAYMVKEKAFTEFASFAEKAKRRLLSKRLFLELVIRFELTTC